MLKGLCTAATLALLTTTWVVAGSEPLPEKAADIRPWLIGVRAPEVNVLTASGEELPLAEPGYRPALYPGHLPRRLVTPLQ